MSSVLKEPYLQDEAAAFAGLEAIVWPKGPVCPHCGCMGRIAALNGVKDKKGRERLGLKKCYDCRQQFTVRVGTIFERSHVPLHIWFQAAYLMCSSKKGVSSNQLHRTLGVTLQTAWFMSHRLREAMRTGSLAPMGGVGGTVEADDLAEFDFRYNNRVRLGVGDSERATIALRGIVGRRLTYRDSLERPE